MAGEFDLIAIVRVAEHDHLAEVIPGGISKVEGVDRTETLIAFQVYSKHDLERMFSVGFEEVLAPVDRDRERRAPPVVEVTLVPRPVLLHDDPLASCPRTVHDRRAFVVRLSPPISSTTSGEIEVPHQSDRSPLPDRRYATPSASANQISILWGSPEWRPVVVR